MLDIVYYGNKNVGNSSLTKRKRPNIRGSRTIKPVPIVLHLVNNLERKRIINSAGRLDTKRPNRRTNRNNRAIVITMTKSQIVEAPLEEGVAVELDVDEEVDLNEEKDMLMQQTMRKLHNRPYLKIARCQKTAKEY